jgi:hypothetical protein
MSNPTRNNLAPTHNAAGMERSRITMLPATSIHGTSGSRIIIIVGAVRGKKLNIRATSMFGLTKRKPLTMYGTAAKKEKMPTSFWLSCVVAPSAPTPAIRMAYSV